MSTLANTLPYDRITFRVKDNRLIPNVRSTDERVTRGVQLASNNWPYSLFEGKLEITDLTGNSHLVNSNSFLKYIRTPYQSDLDGNYGQFYLVKDVFPLQQTTNDRFSTLQKKVWELLVDSNQGNASQAAAQIHPSCS